MDGFFYNDVEYNAKNSCFLKDLEKFSQESSKQIYVINKPLGERKYSYDYQDSLVVLIPKYKIIFINFGEDNDGFEDYYLDFIEDIGYISDKYEYRKILGRARTWGNKYFDCIRYDEVEYESIEEFLKLYKLNKKEDARNGEFIISLLTGSINNVDRVGETYPETILDQIKRKIVLFDGDQTRFIYNELKKKRITIQGLAGTGKTELLLHKLKDLYTKDKDTRIVFTCHNKILAQNLKVRIPDFFDFMKVEEQIKWNERLWVINGWGSEKNKDSGLYAYICNYYKIPFHRYSYANSFNKVCDQAISELEDISDFKPCFDYILIDESQDFPESFFKLCEKVTDKCIYVAGDIFQNVFDHEIVSKVTPDFLLNRCYRTDPKTLMFAHAVGMGLFRNPPLRWLSDDEWEACGYLIDKKNGKYNLSRKPLRRFEDLEKSSLESIKLVESDRKNYSKKIIDIIEDIIDKNPTVKPDDIGIIFLENIDINYRLCTQLEILIKEKFDWDVNIGYETKERMENTLFISNKNNVKGLEFPFVICITQNKLPLNLQSRNSIYMMLTRSFLTTYFIVSDENSDIIDLLKEGINTINEKGMLVINEPSEDEKERLRNAIINNNMVNQSPYDFIESIMDEMKIEMKYREKLHKIIEITNPDLYDKYRIKKIIENNIDLMK